MSLKQECVDIIKLIIEPLRQNDYDFYDLETDCIRDICERTGEDITYSDCQGCDNYEKSCPYKKFVQVDVSFWDGADCQRKYVFSKNPSVSKGVCSIKNRKQLMAEMSKLKKELEKYKDWCADFGKQYSDYMEYAREFGEKLKKDCCLFSPVNTEILPIVFHTDFAKDEKGNPDYIKAGDLCIYGNQTVINTYYCMDDIEATKRNIRHELIHYFLYMSNMKYKDDDAIFHYLCGLYDAHAYKDMGAEEQELYDRLTVAISKMEKICKELNLDEENFQANCIAMLFAVGTNKENVSNKDLFENGMQLLELSERLNEREK